MNIISILRKPYLATFLASLMLFASCSQYESDIAESNSIDALALKNMHQSIKIDLSKYKVENKSAYAKSSEETNAEILYLENVEYLNNHTLEELFIKNNVDTEIISELEYYENNIDSENVYQELINSFNIENETEASILFTIIEVQKIVEQELANSSKAIMSKSQMKRVSWGCALAIAGVVGVSVFAVMSAPITSGASLVAFITAKGLATVALVEACGDGWGDI